MPIELCAPIAPDDWPGVPIAPVAAGLGFLLVVVAPFMGWVAPPNMVFEVVPAGVAGDDMLPPDMEPELVGVDDGPDIDPPDCAKAVPERAAAPSVMMANRAARVVKVFMVVPLGWAGPCGSGGFGLGRLRPTSIPSSDLTPDRLHSVPHFLAWHSPSNIRACPRVIIRRDRVCLPRKRY